MPKRGDIITFEAPTERTVDAYHVDYEHPEKTIETAINMQEQYYKSIGMPTDLRSLGVKEEDLEKLALKCTRNKSRNLPGYKTLEYGDILNIYRMAY